jgi:hypothetical protein
MGSPLGSVPGLVHFNDPQYRLQQNLPSFTTHWQTGRNPNPEAQILHLFSLDTTPEGICMFLLLLLTCLSYLCKTNTQRTNQLHCHSPNYLELTYQQYYQRDFSQEVMVTLKKLSNCFTNLLTAVSCCMCIAQG